MNYCVVDFELNHENKGFEDFLFLRNSHGAVLLLGHVSEGVRFGLRLCPPIQCMLHAALAAAQPPLAGCVLLHTEAACPVAAQASTLWGCARATGEPPALQLLLT